MMTSRRRHRLTCSYAAMVAVMDEGIGNITKTLKAQGMYDNSVMVLSNDNGGASPGTQNQHTTLVVLYELVS